MPEPASALSPAEAWQGRDFRVVITGRRHLNGPAFSETYVLTVAKIKDDCPIGFHDLVSDAIAHVRQKTTIPADLILGFGIYFTD